MRCGAVWCGPAKDQASTTKVGAVRGARRSPASFFEVRWQRAAKVVYEQNVYALMTLICVQQQQQPERRMCATSSTSIGAEGVKPT